MSNIPSAGGASNASSAGAPSNTPSAGAASNASSAGAASNTPSAGGASNTPSAAAAGNTPAGSGGALATADAALEAALALRFEHAFDIRINFDKRWIFGPISGGARHGYTSVGSGCTVRGPLLNGKLVDFSGADWPVVRPDGVVELNAHYMIEADDGARIYIRNLGYVHGPLRKPGQDPQEAPAIPPYFRCTPYFRAPEGPHDWLNRSVLVGVGQRRPQSSPEGEPDHSLFRYYRII